MLSWTASGKLCPLIIVLTPLYTLTEKLPPILSDIFYD
jgi:hypothetical protein